MPSTHCSRRTFFPALLLQSISHQTQFSVLSFVYFYPSISTYCHCHCPGSSFPTRKNCSRLYLQHFIFSSWRVLQIFLKVVSMGDFIKTIKKEDRYVLSLEIPSLPLALPIPSYSVATCSGKFLSLLIYLSFSAPSDKELLDISQPFAWCKKIIHGM